MIGVGGSLVTLAAIHLGLSEFDPKRVHGHVLRRKWLAETADRLAQMSQNEIAALIPFDSRRARVLTAGTFLWSAVLDRYDADRVTVSVRGLRWGVAARLAGDMQA
jgi:exopolyphosphatase/guanosine-5'-triphosphate,3'-diphosphate pyrophosphatase